MSRFQAQQRVQERKEIVKNESRDEKSKGIFSEFCSKVFRGSWRAMVFPDGSFFDHRVGSYWILPWYSDVWHLVLHTSIAILTLFIVILLQSAQNREMKALQLKLDELIKSGERSRDGLVNLQELSDEELESVRKEFELVQRQKRTAAGPNDE